MTLAAQKQCIWWRNAKLGGEIHKLVQFWVILEIMRKLHVPNGYYGWFKETKDDILSSFVKIINFNTTRFLHAETYSKPEIKAAEMPCDITAVLFKLEELLEK